MPPARVIDSISSSTRKTHKSLASGETYEDRKAELKEPPGSAAHPCSEKPWRNIHVAPVRVLQKEKPLEFRNWLQPLQKCEDPARS